MVRLSTLRVSLLNGCSINYNSHNILSCGGDSICCHTGEGTYYRIIDCDSYNGYHTYLILFIPKANTPEYTKTEVGEFEE